MGRRSASVLVAVALCAAVAGMRPASVHASITPGRIFTETGVAGAGTALQVAQGPFSLALSGAHLYVGDGNNAVVRDLDSSTGNETVYAGNNGYGFRGDAGLATSAMISGAGAMVHCGTNTFFADTANNVIRKVDGSGVITTVAGNGTPGYSGDGGPATSAQLFQPLGLACRTGGGLYIADTFNGAIRVLDAGGNIFTWWKGFYSPSGIVEIGSHLVDVAETGFNAVWQLTDVNATVLAGDGALGAPGSSGNGGPATSALLRSPTGLAWDAAYGELYIADTLNHEVRKVAAGVITRLAGLEPPAAPGFGGDTGPPTLATLNQPVGLALTGSRVGTTDVMYIADSLNYRVRLINYSAGQPNITTVAGNGTPSWSGDGGLAGLAQLGNPFGMAFDGAGNEYILDNQDNVVRKITAATGIISTVAGIARQPGGFFGDGGPAVSANLNSPRGIAVDAAGNIAIADTGNQRVRWVNTAGTISTIAGNGTAGNTGNGTPATTFELNLPRGVAIDGSGNVFIADTANNRVQKISSTTMTTYAGAAGGAPGSSGDAGPAASALLNGPRALAFDGSGNLFISDSNNNKVRRVTPGGALISTYAGNGTAGLSGDLGLSPAAELNHPWGIAIDGSGRLFIADTGNQRIRLVSAAGVITSVVATCGISAGFSGDEGQAAAAQLNGPFGIAVNAAGDLHIADVNNNRVRVGLMLPQTRPALCPSSAAPALNGRSSPVQTGNNPPGGLRIPSMDRSAGSATGLAGGSHLRMLQAAQPAAVPPVAAKPAAAAPIAAAPVAAETAVRPPAEQAQPLTRRGGAMVAGVRLAATKREDQFSSLPVVVVIALAIVAITLLAVRRRKNRRLIGRTRP